MAAKAVSSLEEKLLQLLGGNSKLLAGAEQALMNLLDQVRTLRVALRDGEISKKIRDSKQLIILEKDIVSTVCKIEDDIDNFLVQANLPQEKSIFRLFKRLDFNGGDKFQNHSSKITILDRINQIGHFTDILDRINQIKHSTGSHDNIDQTKQSTGKYQPNAKRVMTADLLRRDRRDIVRAHVKPQDDRFELVGLDDEATILIERLVEGSKDLVCIPILGMIGVGKTTLARKVCEDSRTLHEFFTIIWIDVGQSTNKRDIFVKILTHFRKHIEIKVYQDMYMGEIGREIFEFVANAEGRCLIVLDDMWEREVVYSLVHVFRGTNKGHRIMLTSRDRSVATYGNKDPHHMKFLTDSECFQLLKMRTALTPSCPSEFVELGERIARKCSGLPLAVVAITAILVSLRRLSDWERVEEKVEQYLIDRHAPSSCLKLVNTSYTLLSDHTQECFLYLGVFPKDFDIPAWKLICLWIAEGLIKTNIPEMLEKTAMNYLNELVNSNLVIVTQKALDGNVKTCRVHGMLHQFCKEEASSKWLFKEVHPTPDQATRIMQNPIAFHRLCIHPLALTDFLSSKLLVENVRSIYCNSSEGIQRELSDNVIQLIRRAFPLIKVLDIQSLNFVFPNDFNRLFHLRYIAISGEFHTLPKSFDQFLNLQTLVVNTSTPNSTLDIQANIWNMSQLRHLHTNIPAKLPPPPTQNGNSRIHTLSQVAPESCMKDVLAKACNIRLLSIRGPLVTFLETNNNGCVNLEELKFLEELKLLNHPLYMNLRFPLAFCRFVRRLKKLTLSNTMVDWSEAHRLGMLEYLEVLKLKENAFVGEYWKPKSGGFCRLQVLWIERTELKYWEASVSHFPELRHLFLMSCEDLEAVPYGLADVPSLQEMTLVNTLRAVKSAKEIELRMKLKSIKFKLSILPPN